MSCATESHVYVIFGATGNLAMAKLLPYPGRPGQFVPTALGYGGQRLFVLPQQELVAAFTGWNPGGKDSLPFDKALRVLVQAGAE